MKDSLKRLTLGVSAVVTIGMAAAGCATPWFGSSKTAADAPAQPSVTNDAKGATASYINALCRLPKDQRDPRVRELNEALLPNHATISCGPGSGSD